MFFQKTSKQNDQNFDQFISTDINFYLKKYSFLFVLFFVYSNLKQNQNYSFFVGASFPIISKNEDLPIHAYF